MQLSKDSEVNPVSATLTVSNREIKQILSPSPSTSDPSKLWELAQKANLLADIVEENWDEIPQQTQELLVIFAYSYIDAYTKKPKGLKAKFISFLLFFGQFSLVFIFFWMLLKGEIKAFLTYMNASQRLVNAVLMAIEREENTYEETLLKSINEVLIEKKSSEAMTSEAACERIRRISDQVIREL